MEQPSAIEIAALTTGLCVLALRSSTIRLILAIADSRERLALAWLCSSVADTTEAISATPHSSASLTPRSFSASATPCAPGSEATVATTSRTSTNCGKVLQGGTSRPRNVGHRRHIHRGLLCRGRWKFLHQLQAVAQAYFAQGDAVARVDVLIAGHENLTRRCRLIFVCSTRCEWMRYRRRAPAPSVPRRYCRRSIRPAAQERGTACRRR